MKCPRCGIDNFQDAKTCIGCGYNFVNPEANNVPEKKINNNSSNLASIFNTTTINNDNNEQNEVLFAEDLMKPKTEVLDEEPINKSQSINSAPVFNFGNLTSQGANDPQPELLNNQSVQLEQNDNSAQNRFFTGAINTQPQNISDIGFTNIPVNDSKLNKIKNKIPLKPIFITLGIIIVGVILLILARKVVFTPKTGNQPSLFNGSVLIPFKRDGKFGYINSDGQVVIEPKYEYATAYQGNYAIVKDEGKSEYKLIDTNGEIRKATSSVNRLDYYPDYDVWIIDKKLYNSDLELVTGEDVTVNYSSLYEGYLTWNDEANDHLGIMDMYGKVIYTYDDSKQKAHPTILLDVPEVSRKFSDKYCIVNIYGFGYSILNCDTGNVVYDLTNSTITKLNNNIFQIKDPISGASKTIYVQNDRVLYQTSDEKVSVSYNEDGYIVIQDSSLVSRTDANGTQITSLKDPEYINIVTGVISNEIPIYSGTSDRTDWEKKTGIYKKTCGDGKVTLILNNATLLDCEYEELDFFANSLYDYLKSETKEYVIGKKGSKYYLVNLSDGSEIATFNTKQVNKSNKSTFVYYTDFSSKVVVYNLLSNNSVTISGDVKVELFPTYVTLTYVDRIEYYNTDMKLIYTQNEL